MRAPPCLNFIFETHVVGVPQHARNRRTRGDLVNAAHTPSHSTFFSHESHTSSPRISKSAHSTHPSTPLIPHQQSPITAAKRTHVPVSVLSRLASPTARTSNIPHRHGPPRRETARASAPHAHPRPSSHANRMPSRRGGRCCTAPHRHRPCPPSSFRK